MTCLVYFSRPLNFNRPCCATLHRLVACGRHQLRKLERIKCEPLGGRCCVNSARKSRGGRIGKGAASLLFGLLRAVCRFANSANNVKLFRRSSTSDKTVWRHRRQVLYSASIPQENSRLLPACYQSAWKPEATSLETRETSTAPSRA